MVAPVDEGAHGPVRRQQRAGKFETAETGPDNDDVMKDAIHVFAAVTFCGDQAMQGWGGTRRNKRHTGSGRHFRTDL